MDTPNNSAKAFTDAIKQMAAAECKKIDDETEEIRNQRLESLQKETKSRYKSYLEYEVSRIKADTNRQLSSLEENAKRQLTQLRNELCDKVFSKVESDVSEFVKTDEYKALLIRSVKEITQEAPIENLSFFVSRRDEKLIAALSEEFGKDAEFSVSDDIIFGGVKAIDRKTDCLFDNTLDSKLEEQKEWFYKDSGLKV